MKKLFLWFLIGTILVTSCNASDSIEWFWSTPLEVLDAVVEKGNEGNPIQDTKLNTISKEKWSFDSKNRISNTLDAIRQWVSPYLQRAMYIGLSIAVILIIINGRKLVMTPLEGDQFNAVKTSITNIVLWVLILTWFYFIIQITLSILENLFK